MLGDHIYRHSDVLCLCMWDKSLRVYLVNPREKGLLLSEKGEREKQSIETCCREVQHRERLREKNTVVTV